MLNIHALKLKVNQINEKNLIVDFYREMNPK